MYETMSVWETQPALAAQSELMTDFANVWQTADTRLDRRFDPDPVRDMKTSAASDFTVRGPTLAAHAFNAGLVDECHLFVHPVLVGQSKPASPSDARAQLELPEEHGFGNGVVYLRYRTRADPPGGSAPSLRFDDPNRAASQATNNGCWKRRSRRRSRSSIGPSVRHRFSSRSMLSASAFAYRYR
jgi:hypothetical protein